MQHLPAERNFLRLEDEALCGYAPSRFVVFEAPYEHTSSYRSGSAAGPQAIVRASHYVELYDEVLEQETVRRAGICTAPPLPFGTHVDEAAIELIDRRVTEILKDDKFPVMLGAEHTVTLGSVRAVQRQFPRVSVLQIDAHSDLRDSYEGNRYSHASVMARVIDLGIPLVQVGVRALCIEEAELIRSGGTRHTLFAHRLHELPTKRWVEQVVSHLGDQVYITIDADGFDPSVIPAVGTAEPGGLTWDDGQALLKQVCAEREVVGFDVVEIAPSQESTISEYLLAKLVYRLIGWLTLRPSAKGAFSPSGGESRSRSER
jgi:agmatinase